MRVQGTLVKVLSYVDEVGVTAKGVESYRLQVVALVIEVPAKSFAQRVEETYNTMHALGWTELNKEISVLGDIAIPPEHKSKCFFPSNKIHPNYGARYPEKPNVTILPSL